MQNSVLQVPQIYNVYNPLAFNFSFKLKKMLWRWGKALEQFRWKEEELEKMQVFYEIQKKVWGGNRKEKAEKELERIEREHRAEVGRLRIEMVEILREKAKVDEMIKRMTIDEGMFIQMRFEKGYGFDYISMKMHLSRATLFRMQDRILEKMLRWCKDESEKDCIETL